MRLHKGLSCEPSTGQTHACVAGLQLRDKHQQSAASPGVQPEVERSGRVTPPGHPAYFFQPKDDLVYDKKTPLSGHANGMRLSALDKDGRVLLTQIYYSIGGGFVVTDTELLAMQKQKKQASNHKVPYPFASAKEMLAMAAYGAIARAKGFLLVSSSPLTRSSHHAGEDFAKLRAARMARHAAI